MAHFARVDKITKKVLHVHVVNNSDCIDPKTQQENEAVGVAYLNKVHANQPWINDIEFVQTSYNATTRKNYAGKGYTYNSYIDGFVPPKPFDSWALNQETAKWEPPVEMPKDGNAYFWDEKNQVWVKIIKEA